MGGTANAAGGRIGVLVSGSGTNLGAILDAGLPVAVVVSDRPGVGALDRAAAAGIPGVVVERSAYLPDREAFTAAVTEALVAHGADIVAMAGFMTILTESIFAAFPERILNTHPALLPSFRGAHAVADALAAGVKVTGATIHVATLVVDEGPILAQEAVAVGPGDDEASLHERIKEVERRLYPQVLATMIEELVGVPAEATDDAEQGWVPVRRALVSVYDKTGLMPFASALAGMGVTLVASGGTHRQLTEAGIPVLAVEDVTGAPEMMDGRVKTLHPKIHGGILADRGVASHRADLVANGIEPIDLVVANLYPFLSEPSIEMIDIGGP
ncbi:MAG: phosphoribosylglycinamide formyltransferase, partial [Acidimicrobiia bacterium]